MTETKKFESPFTWNISEQCISNFNEDELSADEEVPFFTLMNSVMTTYICAAKANYNKAQKNFQKTEEIWDCLDKEQMQKEGIAVEIVFCIIHMTKYSVLKEIENHIEADKLMNNLHQLKLVDCPINRSTLYGCKSVAWSVFHESTMEMAISFARLAISNNPNCSMWHFILGKNLRRYRRYEALLSSPCFEEIECFQKSYNLSMNPLYGIYAAHAYQENKDYEISDSLHDEIYRMQPENYKIQLRLALGFLRKHDLIKAKYCLDHVERSSSECNMFFHYKGIYYLKCKNLQLAAKYLKKARNDKNFGADLQYGQCMAKLDNNFNYLLHLLYMLRTYKNDNVQQQKILLHVGVEYYMDQSYERSLKYLVQAIKIIPQSNVLKKFCHSYFYDGINIFQFIDNILLPDYHMNSMVISAEMLNNLQELKTIRNQFNIINEQEKIANDNKLSDKNDFESSLIMQLVPYKIYMFFILFIILILFYFSI